MSVPLSDSVPTPDFYTYQWLPLISAVVDQPFVDLAWADGTTLRAYGWWLRESVVAVGATDPTTREGTVDPADFADHLRVTTAAIDTEGALTLAFSDGFSGIIHPGWLHHVALGHNQPESGLPTMTVWTPETLPSPPTFDGADLLSGDTNQLTAFVRAMVEYGLARLANVPAVVGDGTNQAGPEQTEGLAAITDLIGVRRRTNFGELWNVKAEITGNFENTTANTGFRLGPHTDLPTRETPPGFQFLHCVANSVPGGWSTMADGAALVAHLEAEEPETYEALTTLNWVFFNRSREHDHRWRGPMIDRGGPESPLTLRAFYPLRAFPDMDPDDVPRAYRAAKRFHQLAGDPRFQIRYPFAAGDLVGFDNRRILHGRDAFDPGAGFRHLRGTYIDHDEVYSRLRVLTRQQAAAATWAEASTPTSDPTPAPLLTPLPPSNLPTEVEYSEGNQEVVAP
ncbi:MAG: TauD/TfdA family dioxygenase [Acidimicrobiia bacterium]|nr:TauD/TfdA family dioxygenase [Acidimicrobiia bacterium]